MGIQQDFYRRRLTELEELLKKSQSQTSRALLQEAIDLTRRAFTECDRVFQLAQQKLIFYDKAKEKFDEGLRQMETAVATISASVKTDFFSEDTKNKIIAAGEGMQKDMQYEYDRRNNANRQLHIAIKQCSTDLKHTLLELIFKPNSSSFISDAVFSVFTKIVTGLIPYSDNVEILLEGSVKRRKAQYLETGDKLLIYLEDYINVLKAWLSFNEQFQKEVLF